LCQVCAILWSKEYKELVSSHGFAQNQLIIWKYPALTKVAELSGQLIFYVRLVVNVQLSSHSCLSFALYNIIHVYDIIFQHSDIAIYASTVIVMVKISVCLSVHCASTLGS